jgi:hypothetical protein
MTGLDILRLQGEMNLHTQRGFLTATSSMSDTMASHLDTSITVCQKIQIQAADAK